MGVRFNIKMEPGKWHRLGISIKGNSATAILDCNQQDTREIKRNKIQQKTDGVILFGQEIDDTDYFDGDIQHLMIVPNPEAAYNLCSEYIPDCSKPPGPPGELPLLPPDILFQRDAPSRPKREARGDAISSKPPQESDVDLITVYTDIYNMRIELEKIKKPTGTRSNPARTCQDLHYGHPQIKDGYYWIDPNLGMTDDAVKVYCNMSAGGETCVTPDIHASRMPNIPWRKSTEGWYSTLRGGFRISYDSLGPVQLTFLRLLSNEAYQNFTYTCINSAAWYDSSTGNLNNAIKLQGDNEEEFSPLNNSPNILMDGCRNKRRESKTVFEVRTKRIGQLPLVDFYPIDYGKPHQAFGFEVGPVCFR